MTNPEIINRIPAANCPACQWKRLHDAEDWKMHPYAGHGFVREHGWTHPALDPSAQIVGKEHRWYQHPLGSLAYAEAAEDAAAALK